MAELTREELALVRAGLDEDEKAAKAAESETWRLTQDMDDFSGDALMEYVTLRTKDGSPLADDRGRGDSGLLTEDLAHIARHDPARVLRDVQVWRQILTDYEKEVWVMEQGHRSGWTEGGQAVRETVLRQLALSYAEPTDA